MSRPPRDPVPNADDLLTTLTATLDNLREFTEWLHAATEVTDLAGELGERKPDEREDGIRE